MLVEETRPTRKSYGSVIDAGPYQEPLSIAIPPLNPGDFLRKQFFSILFVLYTIVQ